MKAKIITLCSASLLVGLVIGGIGAYKIASFNIPTAADTHASMLGNVGGLVISNDGKKLTTDQVYERVSSDLAMTLINAAPFYSSISNDVARKNVVEVARKSLSSGVLEDVPQSDLRVKASASANCLLLGSEKADAVLPCLQSDNAPPGNRQVAVSR